MGFWPDWWPANPIGSAYDETQKTLDKWKWVFYLIAALIVIFIIIWAYSKVKK